MTECAAWQHLAALAALLFSYRQIVFAGLCLFDFVGQACAALKVSCIQGKEAAGQLLLATRAMPVRLTADEAIHLS